MLTILQGDALSVPISIKLNGKEVTTADFREYTSGQGHDGRR